MSEEKRETTYTFNFTLNGADAENFLMLFQDRINKCNLDILKEMRDNGGEDNETATWLRSHIKYIEDLKEKVKTNMVAIGEDGNKYVYPY